MNKYKTRRELSKVAPYSLGMTEKDLKEKYQLQSIIRMSDNESVYGCSPSVKEAINNQLSSIHFYPDGNTTHIIEKLSSFYEVDSKQFIISNGSEEIIRLLARAFISKGDEAVMADITFPRYETNILLEGGTAVKVPLVDGVHNLSAMDRAISGKTRMVFVCNPNNPTGTTVNSKELLEFIDGVPDDVLVVIDEAYYEYVNGDYLQTVPLLKQYPNLVILRTFSKIYGLAGLRVGYGIMNKGIVDALHKVKDVFNVNQLAQVAAASALSDQAFIQECAKKNHTEIEFVQKQLGEIGVDSFPSETNFLFCYSSHPISQKLLEYGIVVRQMKLTGYEDAFRVTVGTREDNEQFLKAVKEIVSERTVENGLKA
ncbi:histidinol-phosphate transaminase [Bacillus sp. 31A1R]|uniref:Histidinol-phosphate aminotransferase n=1 Tax=Robertmurraya mangrovi TaxID=3098077 RepID=A0ABU5J038_9BACI|nr:histidinol-phosphate transaminase [Bacillus sp. 31A1R]MDZ5472774.1 histidinol-phosphate transaminase [Bacillus sp. 31A1R]